MSPKYTVYYFPAKILGEPIRLILSYGNVEFEDMRIDKSEWPKHKASMPLGQMPVLEIDGKKHVQSLAICRYLAKQFGLAGASNAEAYEIDMIVDTMVDLRKKSADAYDMTDEKMKEQKYAELSDLINVSYKKLEEAAKANKGFLANGKLSWADLHFAGVYDYLTMVTRTDIATKYPNLEKVRTNVLALPQIKAWYAKAPKSKWGF